MGQKAGVIPPANGLRIAEIEGGSYKSVTTGIAMAFLNKEVKVVIDRPMGSRHLEWGFLYPLNYGYVPGVPGGDGEDLDAYVLGILQPVDQFEGVCIAVIHRTDDHDDKLVVVPRHQTYSDEQIRALTEFQERFFTSVILRKA